MAFLKGIQKFAMQEIFLYFSQESLTKINEMKSKNQKNHKKKPAVPDVMIFGNVNAALRCDLQLLRLRPGHVWKHVHLSRLSPDTIWDCRFILVFGIGLQPRHRTHSLHYL